MTTTALPAAERYAKWLNEPYVHMFVLDTEEQRELIHRLRDQAELWLAGLGIDQFTASPESKSAFAHDDIDRLFDAGQFVAFPQSTDVGAKIPGSIGALAAITEPDPDFWTPEEMAEPQAYLSRFLTAEHGRHYGTNLLFQIERLEQYRGSHWIRLDCWRTNKKLHDYYIRHRFERVRTQIVPGRMSGELFQFDLRPKQRVYTGEEVVRSNGGDIGI